MKKILLFSILLIFVFTMGISAADYPSETIKIIVGWSAGGGSDTMARVVAPYLEKHIGVPVIVENRPGSSGEVSFVYLYNAKPDGYTLGLSNVPVLFSPALMREVQYNWREFEPLINVVTDPGVIAVKADDDRFPNMETFLAYAKEHPKLLTIGNTGVGSGDYVSALMLEEEAGVSFNNIAFDGAGECIPALLGGHIDAIGANASEVVQFVESDQMRILGSMSEERYPDYPDVPTFLELGYDLLASSSRGISAPPGTPDDVLEILGEAFAKAVNDPEFQEQAKIAGLALNIKLLDDYRVMRDNMWEDYEELYSKRPWGSE